MQEPAKPWWKEPTRAQWSAFAAAWVGWVLDAFDTTVLLLVMRHIAKEFDVSIAAVSGSMTRSPSQTPNREPPPADVVKVTRRIVAPIWTMVLVWTQVQTSCKLRPRPTSVKGQFPTDSLGSI